LSISGLLKSSQLFIALCAAALGTESYLISGSAVNPGTIAVIFFAALFIYNASRLSLSVIKKSNQSRYSFEVEGSSLSITICLVAIVVLFGLLTACNWLQVLIFMGTSLLSLIYMMPFKRNGSRIHGLRNILLLKNIVLSVTWASATVLFPLFHYDYYMTGNELVFMFLRRFFFIYSLTVIYDLRDLEADKHAGMQTIALRYGDKITRIWSLLALAFFAVFIITDPALSSPQTTALAGALMLSALVTALIILNAGRLRKKSYYSFVVDGAMAIQFVLVLLLQEV
jgi:4-hydroxybenzoate polyprenyltransferase